MSDRTVTLMDGTVMNLDDPAAGDEGSAGAVASAAGEGAGVVVDDADIDWTDPTGQTRKKKLAPADDGGRWTTWDESDKPNPNIITLRTGETVDLNVNDAVAAVDGVEILVPGVNDAEALEETFVSDHMNVIKAYGIYIPSATEVRGWWETERVRRAWRATVEFFTGTLYGRLLACLLVCAVLVGVYISYRNAKTFSRREWKAVFAMLAVVVIAGMLAVMA